MNYSVMTTEQLETLKSVIEEKLNNYVGMSFMSKRSELVSYEIDSIDSDSIMITANHFFDGVIRDYTVTIFDGVNDDVEYNRYNSDEEIVDGGYMSIDRLQKNLRTAIYEIYSLYQNLERISDIPDTRSEEEEEAEAEEAEAEEAEEADAKEDVVNRDFCHIADVLGFSGFDYDDAKKKLENDHELSDLLYQFAEAEEEDAEEAAEEEGKDHTMNRMTAYNAYTANRDFRYIANALCFSGFDYDDSDDEFGTKLENDDKLGDLLEQFKDIESSPLLMYYQNSIDFYKKHEYDILSYLRIYGYDDNEGLQNIDDIMCSRVTSYVTGVLSEYDC